MHNCYCPPKLFVLSKVAVIPIMLVIYLFVFVGSRKDKFTESLAVELHVIRHSYCAILEGG